MGVEKFSRYEIREELGQGGMATVYRAYDPMFEREVALKLLTRESLKEPQVRERFERETKIIARLEHAAIVPVYDVGRDRDQLFFVMRYMAGGTLVERIQNGALSLGEVAHILQRIAAALDYAHSKGIIHRDVKPGNILFDEYNNAYISDFGIAKFAQAAIRLTNSGIIGTPTHMSPEQARGEDVDGRSDIYSLGVILFEMLSGKTPFEATTPLGMAFKHASEQPPHIRDINPNLPPGVEPIIDKVLAKDRDQRYSTGAALADAFISTLAQPLPADISLLTPIVYKTKPTVKEEVEVIPASTPSSRPGLWMLGGFILLALAMLAVWGSTRIPTPLTSTAQPATATLVPSTATQLPTATVTPPPTATLTPVVLLDPGVGGADQLALTANNEIYLMNIDGSELQSLTRTGVPKLDLQWVPGANMLLYIQGNCVYRIDVASETSEPEELACYQDSPFAGFRISPDGEWVAVSISHRLLVLPFDLEALSAASSTFELQQMEGLCLDYAEVNVRDAQWSDDGRKLAVRYQSVIGNRSGDTIRVIEINKQRCQAVETIIRDDFPRRFVPEGYDRYPILPSFDWDGDQQFVFNTFKRNKNYGELYLYDMVSETARKINPIDGVCCYGNAEFSPDGTYILLVFQDVRQGAESENQLFYLPLDKIGTVADVSPIRLPLLFRDLRENVQLALHAALP